MVVETLSAAGGAVHPAASGSSSAAPAASVRRKNGRLKALCMSAPPVPSLLPVLAWYRSGAGAPAAARIPEHLLPLVQQ